MRIYLLSALILVSSVPLGVNYANYADCCARRLLAIQPDFASQLCEIEERIRNVPGSEGRHQVMYYSKFHCELNHIEYFWCHSKRHARENCDYSIDGLSIYLSMLIGPKDKTRSRYREKPHMPGSLGTFWSLPLQKWPINQYILFYSTFGPRIKKMWGVGPIVQ